MQVHILQIFHYCHPQAQFILMNMNEDGICITQQAMQYA
jgi:hypothetical protein